MGVEHRFLKTILDSTAGQPLVGRIIETPRNNPVRNLYRDNGFIRRADGAWTSEAQQFLAG